MSLTTIAAEMEQEARNQRKQEQTILQEIAVMTSPEFAEQAADILDSKKHPYSFEVYLILLKRLQSLISASVPNHLALDAVQTCETAETLINTWRLQIHEMNNI